MAKVISDNIGGFYQHYPKVPVIVSARAGGKSNAMSAAWHTAVSHTPPLYGVSISPKRFTYQLIIDSREFAVNFVSYGMVEMITLIGSSKGNEVNKFEKFNIPTEKSAKTGAPVLQDAYAAYECRLVDDVTCGDHQFLVGEIVAVHQLEEAFTSDEVLDLNKINPALYLGHDFYATTAKNTVKFLDRGVEGRR